MTGGQAVYASLQILQKAIESVGELDREKVTDAIREQKFDTITGKMWFENQLLANYWSLVVHREHPNAVRQFQGGEYYGLSPSDRDGAKPILFPKPEWKN